MPVNREEWGAAPPLGVGEIVELPLKHVQITQTSTDECDNKEQCSAILRDIQRSHVSRNMSDIAYNFLVGNDGNVYEGRGWKKKCGFQNENIVIAFMGMY